MYIFLILVDQEKKYSILDLTNVMSLLLRVNNIRAKKNKLCSVSQEDVKNSIKNYFKQLKDPKV